MLWRQTWPVWLCCRYSSSSGQSRDMWSWLCMRESPSLNRVVVVDVVDDGDGYGVWAAILAPGEERCEVRVSGEPPLAGVVAVRGGHRSLHWPPGVKPRCEPHPLVKQGQVWTAKVRTARWRPNTFPLPLDPPHLLGARGEKRPHTLERSRLSLSMIIIFIIEQINIRCPDLK